MVDVTSLLTTCGNALDAFEAVLGRVKPPEDPLQALANIDLGLDMVERVHKQVNDILMDRQYAPAPPICQILTPESIWQPPQRWDRHSSR
jgi:hypothetical protein